jgi:hypothetical protein
MLWLGVVSLGAGVGGGWPLLSGCEKTKCDASNRVTPTWLIFKSQVFSQPAVASYQAKTFLKNLKKILQVLK